MFLWALILIQSLFLCEALRGEKNRRGWLLYFLCSLSLYLISRIICSIPNITVGLGLEYISGKREEGLSSAVDRVQHTRFFF